MAAMVSLAIWLGVAIVAVLIMILGAAPTPTARTTPSGAKHDDGFSTKVTFANKPGLVVWERVVNFMGLTGGEAIDISTMFNATWHTMAPRSLKRLQPIKFNATFNINVWADLVAQLNAKQVFTVTTPDGSTICFWGFMQDVGEPTWKEGEPPEVAITIVPTLWDAVNNVESAPVFTQGSGSV